MARRLTPPPLATTLVGVNGIFRPFSLATFRGRVGTFTEVSLEDSFHMEVILPLKGQFNEQVHKINVRMGRLFLSEVERQSTHVRVGISPTSHRWDSVCP